MNRETPFLHSLAILRRLSQGPHQSNGDVFVA